MSERILRQIVASSVFQEQQPVCNHMEEQIVGVPVLKFQETKVIMATSQERASESILEPIEIQDQIMEVVKITPQKPVHRSEEQIVRWGISR